MAPRLLTFLVWLAAGASLVFAAMSLFQQPAERPSGAQAVALLDQPRGSWTRLFGEPAAAGEASDALPASPLATRLKLLGLASPQGAGASPATVASLGAGQPMIGGTVGAGAPGGGRATGGVALIVVDEKPARAFKVGAVIDGDYVVQDLSAQKVRIGRAGGPAEVVLEAPLLPPAATGTPPQASGAAGAAGAVKGPAAAGR